jgi:hypothetical protein
VAEQQEQEREQEREQEQNGEREQEREQREQRQPPQTLEEALTRLGEVESALAEVRREAAERRRTLRERERELETTREQSMSERERELAEARREEREKVASEFAERQARSDIRVAAAGRLRDPDDAILHLPADTLGELLVIEEERERLERAGRAVAELLEAKPYLAAEANENDRAPVLSAGVRTRRESGGGGGESEDGDKWFRRQARRGR